MRIHLAVVLSAALAFSAAAAEAGVPGTKLYINADVAATAAARLHGSGIALPNGLASRPATDAHGRAVVWREVARQTDEVGGKHVWYQQFVTGDGLEAEISLSHVGLHYDADGALTLVSGRQFDPVVLTNDPLIDRIAAAQRARQAMRGFARFRTGGNEFLVTDEETATRGRLQIVADERDGELRFVWRVPVVHVDEGPHLVFVDAASERIVSKLRDARSNNCFPDSTAHVTAYGRPVRDDLRNNGVTRTLAATPSSARSPYTHEAFWSYGPYLGVNQETTDSAWACSTTDQHNTLVPIRTVNGSPWYDDDGTFLRGRVAGDAMHNMKNTMQAFATMGRVSWDGAGASAGIVIESTYLGTAAPDRAVFVTEPDPGEVRDPRIPPGKGIVAIGPAANYYSQAAALDVVAHEFGHGVTWTGPDFAVEDQNATVRDIARQLDEGWADVIGNIVEKLRQTSGTGVEQSSDWTMHEDSAGFQPGTTTLGYARGARDDGTAGHIWYYRNGGAPAAVRDRLHTQDPDVTTYNGWEPEHSFGNMLVVALRLLTEGGSNPICARLNTLYACPNGQNPTAVAGTGLGFTNARKLMWNALFRLNSTSNWTDVANAAMDSAFYTFKACGASPTYVPVAEQEAARAAFTAIGYPPTVAVRYSCN